MIAKETVDAILAKADIVDVISKYIQVVKKGRNYVAICPFHDDHDPSMSISAEKQIYKCFVCGKGGNAIQFIMEYEHISYPQAIIKLGSMVGINVVDDSSYHKPMNPKIEKAHHALNLMVQFTNFNLLQTKDIQLKNYCSSRDLNKEVIEKFSVGYNDANDVVTHFLISKGVDSLDLVAANISQYDRNNQLHDVFASRLTFPIKDIHSNCIGFTARSLDPNANSKYINTSETILFKKGELVYNIDQAQNACRKSNQVILVEGVMDVIAFDKSGIENVVSTLGTACTRHQLSLIKQLATTLIFAYDGDKAGQNAIFKAGQLAHQLGFNIMVVNNPTHLDPDELYLSKGKDALVNLVSQPIAWLEFIYAYFKKQFNLDDYNQRKNFVNSFIKALTNYGDAFDYQVFTQRIKDDTQLDISTLVNSVQEKPIIQPKQTAPVNSSQSNSFFKNKSMRIQAMILSQLFLDLKAQEDYQNKLGYLPNPIFDRIARNYLRSCNRNQLIGLNQYIVSVTDEQEKQLLNAIAFDESLTSSYNPKALDEAINQLDKEIKRECISQKRQALRNEFDPKRKLELEKEIAHLYSLIKSK